MIGFYNENSVKISKPDVDISKLLEEDGVNSQLLLLEASKQSCLAQMEELVSKWGADVNAVIELTSPFGKNESVSHTATPLFAAVDNAALSAVEWLLSCHADPNTEIKFPGDGNTTTPIWTAAEKGHVRIAKLLLDHGADVNRAKKCNGNTPLYVAVQNKNSLMVSLLLSHGADPNMTRVPKVFGTLSPLELAVSCGHPKFVAQLIHGGAVIGDALIHFSGIMRTKESPVISSANKKKRRISDEELMQIKDLLDVKPSLRDHPSYTKAKYAEKKGNYREALHLIRSLHRLIPCVQTKFDIDRLIEAIYGIQGSDLTTSIWTNLPLISEPTHCQHYAWAQIGREIYRHGGCDMTVRVPDNKEELWVLNIDTLMWKKISTGKSPGPRSGHTMFAWKDYLYLWGGNSTMGYDSKLYRLNVKSGARVLNWETVKTSSLKPEGREEHAGCVYKGKYYISGGMVYDELSNELWSLDLTSFKWKWLNSGPVERHCHGMWAVNDKIFMLGGRQMHDKSICTPFTYSYSIEEFTSFDLEKKVWKTEDVIGDRPFDLSEMTVLPIYGESSDDPTSIIIWGGYSEFNTVNGLDPNNIKEMEAHYGHEYQDYQKCSYRNRILRYCTETNVWKKLEPTSPVLPKAQSFAAVKSYRSDSLHLLIGGGYGFTGDSEISGYDNLEIWDLIDREEFPPPKDLMRTPKYSNKVYEVVIGNLADTDFATNISDGDHWALNFFRNQGISVIVPDLDCPQFSPTLHTLVDVVREDFFEPPCDIIAHDDDNLLGVRAQINGLVGRRDLNGQVARIGRWFKEKERYQVFLPNHEPGGPASLLVKPSNLVIAKPIGASEVQELLFKHPFDRPKKFPDVCMKMNVKKCGGKVLRPYLDQIVDPQKCQDECLFQIMDIYYGPVSGRAQSILRSVCFPQFMFTPMMGCLFTAEDNYSNPPTNKQKQHKMRQTIFVDFVRKLQEKDSVRVKEFEKKVEQLDGDEVIEKCGKWLKIRVEVDGFKLSPIYRELLVNPDVTMQRLHSQILCPALGWSPYYHSYAFRRTGCPSEKMNVDCPNEKTKELEYAALMMNECWIGPKGSKAVDAIFMPLYIGGCVANARHITLGKIFALERNGGNPSICYLQYVYDYGDWWSHTISVEKYCGSDAYRIPEESTVTHLIGGQGRSIPEDIGPFYTKRMNQLMGKVPDDAKENDFVNTFLDPAGERWWKMLNEDFLSKPNKINFFASQGEFDHSTIDSSIRIELRRTKQKSDQESIYSRTFNCLTGLAIESDTCVEPTQDNPKKYCAVCGVTIALKLCSACKSVAYCSQEHQKKDRKNHTKLCKQVQKQRKRKK